MNKQRLISAFEANLPQTPMSEEETRLALFLMTSKDSNINCDINEVDKSSEIYQHFKPLIDAFQMQVFFKRLEHLTSLRITLGAFLMIAQHLNSAGSAVMHAYYLHTKLPANTLVGVTEVSMQLFPWGFFSDEQLKTIWDAQKVRQDDKLDVCTCYGAHDNLLDYIEIWK